MEKKVKPRIGLLVGVILSLGVSVGLLHGRVKANHYSASPQNDAIKLTVADLFDILDPLLMSQSFDAVATVVQKFDEPLVINALEEILKKKHSNLSDEEKMTLLINIASYSKSSLRNKIFSLIAQYYPMHPVFFVTVVDGKGKIIPQMVAWSRSKNPVELDAWIAFSLEQSIVRNSLEALDSLYAQGIRPSSAKASELLYQVIHTNKDPRFVSFLVKQLNADPNFSADNKRTLLIEAVENGNEAFVRALIDAGADPEKILDEQVGTAQQIAYEKGFARIEGIVVEATKKQNGTKK